MTIIELHPAEEESAAVLAAIALYLAEEESVETEHAEPTTLPPDEGTDADVNTAAPDEPRDPFSMMIIGPPPGEEESAAILAAISSYLSEEDVEDEPVSEQWHWSDSKTVTYQGVPPWRYPQRPSWSNIERLRIAGRGTPGIISL
jgi:hypothetical protein